MASIGNLETRECITCARFDSPEVFLDEDGALERTFRLFRSGAFRAVPLLLGLHLLLLNTYQHLGEEIALKLLPRLAVFADTDHTVQPELAKSIAPQSVIITRIHD